MRLEALNRPSLVRRLVLLAALWSLLLLVGAGMALTAFFQRASLSRFERDLYEVTQGLYAGSTVEEGEVVAPPLTDARAVRVYSGRYWEIAEVAPGGGLKPLVRSNSLWDRVLDPPPRGAGSLAVGSTVYYDSPGPLATRLRTAARAVRLLGREDPVIILAAENRSPLDRDARQFAATTAIALVLLGAGLIAAIVIQVRFGLQPLFRLRRQVADVRTGRAERLAADYPVELQPLAAELNALLDHNQEVVDRQRTHVGNLAHALKTPISVMMAEASHNPGPVSDLVLRQTETMQRQVDHHLRRARAAARMQGPRERTPVDEVLDELARTLERIFSVQGVRVEWDAADDLCFHGERQDLLEIVGNLMENACKFCRGRVRATAIADGPALMVVTVEDNGEGLPPERREEVFRRGARLDETAPGSGLGLNIVDELVRVYGGRISLSDSPLGGLRIEVWLPRVEPEK